MTIERDLNGQYRLEKEGIEYIIYPLDSEPESKFLRDLRERAEGTSPEEFAQVIRNAGAQINNLHGLVGKDTEEEKYIYGISVQVSARVGEVNISDPSSAKVTKPELDAKVRSVCNAIENAFAEEKVDRIDPESQMKVSYNNGQSNYPLIGRQIVRTGRIQESDATAQLDSTDQARGVLGVLKTLPDNVFPEALTDAVLAHVLRVQREIQKRTERGQEGQGL